MSFSFGEIRGGGNRFYENIDPKIPKKVVKKRLELKKQQMIMCCF